MGFIRYQRYNFLIFAELFERFRLERYFRQIFWIIEWLKHKVVLVKHELKGRQFSPNGHNGEDLSVLNKRGLA